MSRSSTSGSARVWPFIGRGPERRALRAAVAGRGAVIIGPAGCGKSALVAATVARPAARFIATPAAAGADLWGVRSLLGGADPGTDPAGRLAAALQAVPNRSGTPILVVEDIDHLDPSSTAVLLLLVSNEVIRLIATRRSGPIPPTSVAVLWREAGLARIDLGALGEDDVAEILRGGLGGPLDGRTSVVLSNLVAGNPLLAREVIDASITAGVLVMDRGLWRLDGPVALSPEVGERAESELEGLDPAGRSALELLAFADSLPVPIFARVIPPEVAERLERAGRTAETTRDGQPVVVICSPIVAEHLRRGLPVSTRRRLAALLAEAVGPLAASDSKLELRTVTWLLESGAAVDPARSMAAAWLAIDEGDPGWAERLAEHASHERPDTEAALLASWCADERGDLARAEAILAAHENVGDEAAVVVAIRRAEQRFWGHRDPEGARAVLVSAAALPAPWGLAATAQQAIFDGLDGRPEAAITAALPLLDHPEPLVSSIAALAATFSLTAVDRADQAKTVAEEALAQLAGPMPALFIDPGVHIIGLVFALHGAGQLDEADELISAVYRHTLGRTGRQAQGWAALLRAHVLAARGRPGLAAEAALEAEFVWSGARLEGPARWSATVAALAHADAGEVDELRSCLVRADGYDGVPFRLFESELLRAHGWRAHHDGEPGVADQFELAADLARSTGRSALAAAAAHDLIRIGAPHRAAAVLDGLGETHAPSLVTGARRAMATASATDDGEGLLAVAHRFDEFGAAGWAVEARALAAGYLPAQASALRAQVASTADALGLATPPLQALVHHLPERSLTAREAEVVRLAGSGLSNRAIAEDLVVSLRTVENHLHRAFAKLGVTSRAELPAPLSGPLALD